MLFCWRIVWVSWLRMMAGFAHRLVVYASHFTSTAMTLSSLEYRVTRSRDVFGPPDSWHTKSMAIVCWSVEWKCVI